MASNIDASLPVFGNATTASVRQNFAHAKAEIEALQTGKLNASAQAEIDALETGKLNATAQADIDALEVAHVFRLASIHETLEVFQQCATNDVGQVVQFNTQLFNNPADSFEWDILNNEIIIKKAGWYNWSLGFHVVRKIATGAVDWTIWTQVKEPPALSFSNFPASSRRLTLLPDEANSKSFKSLSFNVRTPVANTRIRFMQACTDVTKQVGIIAYPAVGNYPSLAGLMLSIHRIGLEA